MYKRLESRRGESHLVNCGSIPHMASLRWVPKRYRRMIPLQLMQKYQCVVIGGESNALTAAVTNEKSSALLQSLGQRTGRIIFPVLIEPARMHLLIRRIERAEREKHKPLNTKNLGYPLQVRSMLMFLTTSRK